MENENNENEIQVEILVELNEINVQLANAMEHYCEILEGALDKILKYNLLETIVPDIRRMLHITDRNSSAYVQMHCEMEDILYDKCNHDWCDDYIDGMNYECKKIIYCKKCRLTKQS